MENENLIFKALADPTRRQLLDKLFEKNGQSLGELCQGIGMARQSISQHIDLLIDANFLSVKWEGRTKIHFLNPVPIHQIYERWIKAEQRYHLSALEALKTRIEGDENE